MRSFKEFRLILGNCDLIKLIQEDKFNKKEFFAVCKKCLVDNTNITDADCFENIKKLYSSHKPSYRDAELIEYSFRYRNPEISNFLLENTQNIPILNFKNYIQDTIYYEQSGFWFEKNLDLLKDLIVGYADDIIRINYYGYPKYVFKKERVDELFKLFCRYEEFSSRLSKFILNSEN